MPTVTAGFKTKTNFLMGGSLFVIVQANAVLLKMYADRTMAIGGPPMARGLKNPDMMREIK